VSATFKKQHYYGEDYKYDDVQDILNYWCNVGIWVDDDWHKGSQVYLRHSKQDDKLVVKAADLLEFVQATL